MASPSETARNTTTRTARRAAWGRPAPSSLDTRVLRRACVHNCVVRRQTNANNHPSMMAGIDVMDSVQIVVQVLPDGRAKPKGDHPHEGSSVEAVKDAHFMQSVQAAARH